VGGDFSSPLRGRPGWGFFLHINLKIRIIV